MSRHAEQKIKLLVLYDILQKHTDEMHPMITYQKGGSGGTTNRPSTAAISSHLFIAVSFGNALKINLLKLLSIRKAALTRGGFDMQKQSKNQENQDEKFIWHRGVCLAKTSAARCASPRQAQKRLGNRA